MDRDRGGNDMLAGLCEEEKGSLAGPPLKSADAIWDEWSCLTLAVEASYGFATVGTNGTDRDELGACSVAAA